MQDGGRGHLEGLASVYCEILMAPFGDVLSALENERLAAWSEISPHHRGVGANRGHRGSSSQGGLPNSHSQPIYVPGKYSVSIHSKLGISHDYNSLVGLSIYFPCPHVELVSLATFRWLDYGVEIL